MVFVELTFFQELHREHRNSEFPNGPAFRKQPSDLFRCAIRNGCQDQLQRFGRQPVASRACWGMDPVVSKGSVNPPAPMHRGLVFTGDNHNVRFLIPPPPFPPPPPPRPSLPHPPLLFLYRRVERNKSVIGHSTGSEQMCNHFAWLTRCWCGLWDEDVAYCVPSERWSACLSRCANEFLEQDTRFGR